MQLRGLEPKKNAFIFEYDFKRDGGEIGEHILEGNPIGMERLITHGWIEGKTDVTSEGAATIALSVKSADDVLAATPISSFTAGALMDTKLDGKAANAFVIANPEGQASRIVMTIGGAAITGGKFIVALEGLG